MTAGPQQSRAEGSGLVLAMAEGGVETVLIHHLGFELPGFAAFPLLERDDGRAALRSYVEPFLRGAEQRAMPFVLDTVTWRANPDWGAELGIDRDALAAANRRAVAFARELAHGRPNVLLSGVVGPRGDGYTPGEAMTPEDARAYHDWQIALLADAGVERITALTLPYPNEAIGIVTAARERGVPVVASFTVETDGRLPDGTALSDAIAEVDAATDSAAAFFMINCAHPRHIMRGLGADASLRRLGGLRVNASVLSHAELDAMDELDEGDPDALAIEHAALRDRLPGLQLIGGCCGTDHRHVLRLVDEWQQAMPLISPG